MTVGVDKPQLAGRLGKSWCGFVSGGGCQQESSFFRMESFFLGPLPGWMRPSYIMEDNYVLSKLF